jgi:hypothetical protein
MKLRNRLLSGVSALALIVGASACDRDDHFANDSDTIVVANDADAANTAAAVENATDNEANPA